MSSDSKNDVDIIALAACKDTTIVSTYYGDYDSAFDLKTVDPLQGIFEAQNDYINTLKVKIEQHTRIKFVRFITELRNELAGTNYDTAKASVLKKIADRRKDFITLGKKTKTDKKPDSEKFFDQRLRDFAKNPNFQLIPKGEEEYKLLKAPIGNEYRSLRMHIKQLIQVIRKRIQTTNDNDVIKSLERRNTELCEIKMVDDTSVLKDARFCGKYTKEVPEAKSYSVDEDGKNLTTDEVDEYTLNETMMNKVILQGNTIVESFTTMFARIVEILKKIQTDKPQDATGEYVFKKQIFEIRDILKEQAYDNFVYKALMSLFCVDEELPPSTEEAAKAAFNQMCDNIVRLVQILNDVKTPVIAAPKPRRRTFKRSRKNKRK
jgi:hypothetical protein